MQAQPEKTDSARPAFPPAAAAFALILALSPAATAQEISSPPPAPVPPAPAAPADEVLGKVGEFEVRISDVRKSLETLGEAEREALRREPAALNQYVRALLVQQLVLREALEARWDQSAAVAERMQTLREGVIATTYLESVSEPPAAYPGEAELSAAYAANREALLQPKAWRLSQIFIAAPRAEGQPDSPEAIAKLQKVANALGGSNADFESLAMAESEEPASAARGGEVGWLAEPQIHPDIRAVLPGMELGQISDPVRMDDGWHFIKILDIREAGIPTLEQIREPLSQQLRAERARAETENFLARLLRENPIAINEMVLSKLIPAEGN